MNGRSVVAQRPQQRKPVGPLGQPSDVRLYGTVVVIGGGVGTAIAWPTAVALRQAANTVIGIIGGRGWALLTGMVVAAFAATGQFMFLPYYPIWAMLVIALYVLVIWALAQQWARS